MQSPLALPSYSPSAALMHSALSHPQNASPQAQHSERTWGRNDIE